MATHSNVLAWRIPGTGEPGGFPHPTIYGVAQSQTRLKRLSSSNNSSSRMVEGGREGRNEGEARKRFVLMVEKNETSS